MEQQKNPIIQITKSLIITVAIITLPVLIFVTNIQSIKAEKTPSFSTLVQDEYKKELSLNLPSVIDDPNLEIIFANPSDDKKHPITIIIDNKKFEKAKSPFKLPNLDIGTHHITIKYTNKDGIPRTLNLNISVVPKPPVIDRKNKTLFLRPEPIEIKGQALAFSKVLAVINGTEVQYVPVSAEGHWSLIIKTPKQGKYNIIFYTYENGLISKNFAKTSVTYQINQINDNTQNTKKESLYVRTKKQIINFFNNKNNLYATIFIIAGFLIILLAFKIKKYLQNKWEQKEISELIQTQKPKKNIVKIIEETTSPQTPTNKPIKKKKSKTKKGKKSSTKKQTSKSSSTPISSDTKSQKQTKKNTNNKSKSDTKSDTKPDQKPEKKPKNNTPKTNNKNQTNQNEPTNQKNKANQKQINIKKKVLSKEEFLSMFEKTKK